MKKQTKMIGMAVVILTGNFVAGISLSKPLSVDKIAGDGYSLGDPLRSKKEAETNIFTNRKV